MTNYVPIAELPTYDGQSNNALTWDFDLPPTVDTERLLINQSNVRTIQRLACFSGSSIFAYQGETTAVAPGIGDMYDDGTATMSGVADFSVAPVHNTSLVDEFPFKKVLMGEYGLAHTIHRLNRPELASHVVDRKKEQSLTSETAWAVELNDALNESFRKAAYMHLMNRASSGEKRKVAALTAFIVGGTALEIAASTNPFILEGAAAAWLSFVAVSGIFNRSEFGSTMYDKRRWSVQALGDFQPDRYALACLASRRGKMIKVAK